MMKKMMLRLPFQYALDRLYPERKRNCQNASKMRYTFSSKKLGICNKKSNLPFTIGRISGKALVTWCKSCSVYDKTDRMNEPFLYQAEGYVAGKLGNLAVVSREINLTAHGLIQGKCF